MTKSEVIMAIAYHGAPEGGRLVTRDFKRISVTSVVTKHTFAEAHRLALAGFIETGIQMVTRKLPEEPTGELFNVIHELLIVFRKGMTDLPQLPHELNKFGKEDFDSLIKKTQSLANELNIYYDKPAGESFD